MDEEFRIAQGRIIRAIEPEAWAEFDEGHGVCTEQAGNACLRSIEQAQRLMMEYPDIVPIIAFPLPVTAAGKSTLTLVSSLNAPALPEIHIDPPALQLVPYLEIIAPSEPEPAPDIKSEQGGLTDEQVQMFRDRIREVVDNFNASTPTMLPDWLPTWLLLVLPLVPILVVFAIVMASSAHMRHNYGMTTGGTTTGAVPVVSADTTTTGLEPPDVCANATKV